MFRHVIRGRDVVVWEAASRQRLPAGIGTRPEIVAPAAGVVTLAPASRQAVEVRTLGHLRAD
jgi:hypothetical protein